MSSAVYPVGQAAVTWLPGDFLLTHSAGWVGAAIRFGQRLRLPLTFCWYNHAALVVSDSGDLVEALGHGVCRTNATKYRANEYSIVHSGLSRTERDDAVSFAESMVGSPYGWWTIASIVISLLTGASVRFDRRGTVICSGLVAAALGLPQWRADPSHIMPAELAAHFDVQPSTPRSQAA